MVEIPFWDNTNISLEELAVKIELYDWYRYVCDKQAAFQQKEACRVIQHAAAVLMNLNTHHSFAIQTSYADTHTPSYSNLHPRDNLTVTHLSSNNVARLKVSQTLPLVRRRCPTVLKHLTELQSRKKNLPRFSNLPWVSQFVRRHWRQCCVSPSGLHWVRLHVPKIINMQVAQSFFSFTVSETAVNSKQKWHDVNIINSN